MRHGVLRRSRFPSRPRKPPLNSIHPVFRMCNARSFVLGITAMLLAGCSAAPGDRRPERDGPGGFLFAWVTDADSVDLNYLTVIDAHEGTATYGEVVASLAIPTTGRTRGHHVEHRMPEGGRLFANDFGTGKTYVLDVTNPLAPFVADSFMTAGELMSPHSFERLPNGNVLATFQNRGSGNEEVGGLAELDGNGRLVRAASAHAGDRYIRPYRLAIVPELDRVVTGSADMRGAGDSRVVQIWRLSDLTLLHTLDIPEEWGAAAEPRSLADGKTVLVTTFGCSLLRVTGVDTPSPAIERVHEFGGSNCALPVVSGKYWIQAVPDDGALVVLDVQQPRAPREVSRLRLGEGHWPHWLSLDPQSSRLVVTGYAATRHRLIVVQFDTTSGQMTLDEAFGGADGGPGISFARDQWPHGATGPGDVHGVVFSR